MKGAAQDRIAARETIGSAAAVLRRLDALRLDEDVRREVTRIRQVLSVAYSQLHRRITQELQLHEREDV